MASESTETQQAQGNGPQDGSENARDLTPARRDEGHGPVAKNGNDRSANNLPEGQTVPEQEYSDYVLHYDEDDATSGKIPDVLLDVPVLNVDEIDLEVDDLQAQLNVSAEVLQLTKINVGANVHLGQLKLAIRGIEAQALLKARLDNVTAIVDRVMTTIDRNPEIIEKAVEGVGSAAREVGSGATEAAGQIGEGASQAAGELGQAVGDVADGAGEAVDGAGETAQGASQAAEGVSDAAHQAGESAAEDRNPEGQDPGEDGDQTTERAVDAEGDITETVVNANGETVDERVVGNVADLPVEEEYIDEEGRVVSRVTDDAGNAYEMVLDDGGNMAEARAA